MANQQTNPPQRLYADLRQGGTLALPYPKGTTAATFALGEAHQVDANGALYTAPASFTLAFGASSITMTWLSATTLPKGSRLILAVDEGAAIDSGVPYFLPAGTGATIRTVQDKLRESVSITDFRQPGDAVNDWGGTINRAINAVAAAGGGAVLVPARAFTVDQPIVMQSGVTLIGVSPFGSILVKSGGSNVFDLIGTTVITNDIGVVNIGLDGNRLLQTDPAATQGLVSFGGVSHGSVGVTLDNVRAYNYSAGGHALHAKGFIDRVTFNRCYISDGGDPSLYHAIYLRRCSGVSITYNVMRGALGQSIKVVDNGVDAKNVRIIGNDMSGGFRGINVSDVDDVLIFGNRIASMADTAIRYGIEEESSMTRTIIAENLISDCIIGVDVSSATRLKIRDNLIGECISRGIQINNTSICAIEGNSVINTTTAIPSGGGLEQIRVSTGGTPNIVTIRGNSLRCGVTGGTGRTGIRQAVSTATGIEISGNAFEGGTYSAQINSSSNYTIAPNRVMVVATGLVSDTTPYPTAATGLATGTIYSNAGVLTVAP